MWLLSGWVPPSSSSRGWDASPTAQSGDRAEPEVGVQPPWFLGCDPSSPCCQPCSLGVRWENHKAWSWGILRPGDPSPAWGWLVPGFAEQDLTQLLGRCWEPGVWGMEVPLCRSELQRCTSCPYAHQPRPIPSDACPPPREAGPSGHTRHPRETGWTQEGSASGLRPETSAQSTPRGERGGITRARYSV